MPDLEKRPMWEILRKKETSRRLAEIDSALAAAMGSQWVRAEGWVGEDGSSEGAKAFLVLSQALFAPSL